MRGRSARPGFWAGVVAAGLGLLFLAGAYAVQTHSARGTVLPPDQVFETASGQPVHVVGVLRSDTVERSTTCRARQVSGDSEIVRVGIRSSRLQSIPEGRRLPTGTVRVTCDGQFSVSTGPVVLAYPLAGSSALFAAYLATAVAGLALAGSELRNRRATSRVAATTLASKPLVTPGSHATRSAPSWRRTVATIGFTLALAGTLIMLVLSVTLVRHQYGELVLNLALLLVVIPGALSVAVLLRERRNPSP